MDSVDWQQLKYDQVFEETCLAVERQRQSDPSFTLKSLESLLQAEYVNEENDWVGRGVVQNTVIAARVAAYEHLVAEWRKELNQPE